MNGYLTVKGPGSSEIEDRKSRFLGFIAPVSDESEARAFIARVTSDHPTAKHHVYAYVLWQNSIVRYTDDGEPQGTAGTPMLNVLQKQGLYDCVVVVVRYFGGVLLGTGGLVHAYGEAASLAIKDAGVVCVDRFIDVECRVGYADYQRVLPYLSTFDGMIDDTVFDEKVTILLSVSENKVEDCLTKLTELTGARIEFEKKESKNRKIDFRK